MIKPVTVNRMATNVLDSGCNTVWEMSASVVSVGDPIRTARSRKVNKASLYQNPALEVLLAIVNGDSGVRSEVLISLYRHLRQNN